MLREGQVLVGPQFSEPMVVETVRADGVDTWVVGLVGEHTRQFRRVTLTRDDLQAIRILDRERRFDGDGQLLRLGIEAYRLGIASSSTRTSVSPSPESILSRISSRPCTTTCSNRVACASSWPTTQGPGRRSWLAFCCGN
jgi:hypothetical protein